MAAYSSFGLEIHGSRHGLLSQLVTKLVGVQAGDENHVIALDFALQHAYYHSFADPNPSEVAGFYDGVERRLLEDSQTAKAAALRALRLRALAAPPPPDAPRDHPWPLLSLLAALSGRPLDCQFRETPELLALLYQPTAAEGQPAALRAGGARAQTAGDKQQQARQQAVARRRRLSPLPLRRARRSGGAQSGGLSGGEASGSAAGSDAEVDPFGCSSDLSDWSDGGGEATGHAPQDSEEGDTCTGAWVRDFSIPTSQKGAPQAAAAAAAARWPAAAPPVAPAPELSTRRVAPLPGDLLPMLSALRLGRAPWLAPDPGRCHPQRVLAAAALAALQGDVAEGFLLDQVSGELSVDPQVTTPALSPSALHALLRDFAGAGSAARALLRLSQRLCSAGGWCEGAAGAWGLGHHSLKAGNGGGGAPFGFPVTPCMRAFGTALQEQLAAQGAQLAALQEQLLNPSWRPGPGAAPRWAGSGSDAGALAAARRASAGCILRLQLLQSVADGLVNELGGSPAQTSAALLDCLYRRLASGDPALSGPQGEGTAGALLHLLLSSLMPLLGALGRWLYGGREGDDARCFGGAGADGDGADGSFRAAADDDFFIRQVKVLPVQDPRFWSQAFALSGAKAAASDASPAPAASDARPGAATGPDGAGDDAAAAEGAAACCPSFLEPLASEVLSAGKSLRLLRYMQQEELAAAPLRMRIPDGQGGAGEAPGWQRASPQGSPSRGRQQRRRQRRQRWRQTAPADRGGAQADGAQLDPLGLRLGDSGGGGVRPVVRMSAAARLQLAVAAAAAQHGEDGEAFQAQFVEDSCDLLRRWDEALAARLPAAQAACTAADEDGSRRGLCGFVDHHHQQQQQDMFAALEAAGRQLRCPGSLLRWDEAAGQSMDEATYADSAAAAAAEATLASPTASLEHAGKDLAPACQDLGAPTGSSSGGVCSGDDGGGLAPLTTWGEQLRRDLSAAAECLQWLVPAQGANANTPDGGGSAGTLRGDSGWGSGADDDENDDEDAGVSAGPTEWPAELWPLRRKARRTPPAGGDGRGLGSMAPWMAAPLRPQRRMAWLLTRPPGFVGPVQMLLERALLEPLRERVNCIGTQLLGCLLGEWGLLSELRALAGTFLLASPAVVTWADGLLEAAERGGGLAGLDAAELAMGLQELALQASDDDPLPAPGSLVVSIDHSALEAARAARAGAASAAAAATPGAPGAPQPAARAGPGRQGPSVGELGALQVRHLGSWLLSLVAEPAQLQSYNQATVFLLQLRWARRELDAARMRASKSRLCRAEMAALDAAERRAASEAAAARARHVAAFAQQAAGAAPDGGGVAAAGAAAAASGRWLGLAQEHLFLLEMSHLVAALQQYVMDRLMHGAWAELEKGLAAASSLDEVRRCHAAFQEAALRQCCQGSGRGRGATWRHIGLGLVQLFDVALRACRTHRRLLQLRAESSLCPTGAGAWQSGGSGGAKEKHRRKHDGGGGAAAAAAVAAALEVAALRGELASAAAGWRSGRSYLLRILRNKALQLAGDDDVEALLGALGFNAYYAE